jgi:hypothetical protein
MAAKEEDSEAAILLLQKEFKERFRPEGYIVSLPKETEKAQLASLGIPAEILARCGMENKIDPESVYGKLPRPANLNTKCFISVPKEDYQSIVKKFWNGGFLFRTEETLNKDGTVRCFALRVSAMGEIIEVRRAREGPDVLNLAMVEFEQSKNGDKRHSSCFSPSMCDYVSIAEIQLLGARILHHFLRSCAWAVPKWVVSYGISCCIMPQYSKKRFMNDQIDLKLIQADLTRNFPAALADPTLDIDSPGEDFFKNLLDGIVEILEAMREHVLAGELYREIAEVYVTYELLDAGKQFKRAQKYPEALENLGKALYLYGKSNQGIWNLKDEYTVSLIIQMLSFYDEFCSTLKLARFGAGSYMASPKGKMSPTLATLVYCAKVTPKTPQAKQNLMLNHLIWNTYIQPKYTSRQGAKKILVKAFQSSTVNGFEDAILSALKPKPIPMPPVHPDSFLNTC